MDPPNPLVQASGIAASKDSMSLNENKSKKSDVGDFCNGGGDPKKNKELSKHRPRLEPRLRAGLREAEDVIHEEEHILTMLSGADRVWRKLCSTNQTVASFERKAEGIVQTPPAFLEADILNKLSGYLWNKLPVKAGSMKSSKAPNFEKPSKCNNFQGQRLCEVPKLLKCCIARCETAGARAHAHGPSRSLAISSSDRSACTSQACLPGPQMQASMCRTGRMWVLWHSQLKSIQWGTQGSKCSIVILFRICPTAWPKSVLTC